MRLTFLTTTCGRDHHKTDCLRKRGRNKDIKQIVDGQSQTDPQFRTKRLYTRLTAAQVRRQLIEPKGYTDQQLPQAETIGNKLNLLGYHPKKVKKSLPQKRSQKPTPSLSN
jgi:hypothetical protein